MPIFDLNFTDRYCSHWTAANAVREVVANAEDERPIGGSMSVEHWGEAHRHEPRPTPHDERSPSARRRRGRRSDDRQVWRRSESCARGLPALRDACSHRHGREVWVPRYIQRDGLDRVVAITTRSSP